MKHETATGLAIELQLGAQMSLRIASVPSAFYPAMVDATIPVWAMTEKVVAPDKILGELFVIQGAPDGLAGFITLFMILGGVCLILGLIFIGVIFYRQSKYQQDIVTVK